MTTQRKNIIEYSFQIQTYICLNIFCSAMTTLTWKRKRPSLPTKSEAATVFNSAENDTDEANEEFLEDWRILIPSNKRVMLEDSLLKSKRLQQEAIVLAGEERYILYAFLSQCC